MSEQLKHIMRIRKEKYWLDDSNRRGEQNPLLKDLQQSINKLSRDLYRKDSHFLLELIQNAEDNDYNCDNPTLSFTLVKEDPTNSSLSSGALIIANNEIGFSVDNMEAMCSIGSSFKEKLKGYIGEKGIGFKSVFKITKSPYIYSNNYQVRFKDEINEIGLGYIVPEWVEQLPEIVNQEQTTIILPLNSSKIGFSEVSKMMREFTPETILFLSKIRQLRFSVEGDFDISISKSVDNDYMARLTIATSDYQQTSICHKEHLLYTKNFKRPFDLLVEGREDVMDRDITISFPIGVASNEGAVYAYLPVLENTGLPFILNADFLVPGSRDMIYEDSEWNEWLLEQIPELFVEAFTKLIKISKYRYELFRHIPIESQIKATYFEPIIKPIIKTLSMLPIIPTVPNGKFVLSSVAKSSRDFRKAISGLKLPCSLKERLITEELQKTISSEVAQALGLLGLKSRDVIACLNEGTWVRDIGYQGLLDVFRFLSTWKKNYSADELRGCRILPIKERKKTILSCVTVQPIYFEATKQDIEVLKEKPDCIKVAIRFLDKHFYELIKIDEELLEWINEVLFVYPFSLENYAYDATEWFKNNHNKLSDEQFVAASNYILGHSNSDVKLVEFPILLNNGQRILFSSGKALGKELVTPAGLNPEAGWQLVFSNHDDRNHFLVLSDLYLSNNEKAPNIVTFTKATRNPPLYKLTLYPRQDGWNSWRNNSDYSDKEKEHLDVAYQGSAVSRERDIYISRVIKPSGLSSILTEKTSIALIRWLNGRYKNTYHSSLAKDLMTEIGWYNYGEYTRQVESEMSTFLRNDLWLPSTKGMQKPSHVFKKNSGVYDVLGDTVPYFVHDLTEIVSGFLGIRNELSNEELISYLLDLSTSSEGNIKMAERIYSAFNSRVIEGKVKDKLTAADCIAVPKNGSVVWVSPKMCVWKDRSDLFENEFCFLSTLYPKLQDFFIEVLGVAIDIGDEQFCELWLDIQRREVTDIRETEDKLSMLYHKLKPLFDSTDMNAEEWWQNFLSKAMLWSSGKKFLQISQVYIPDDGILKEVFDKEQIGYLWYPRGSSYSQWGPMHSAFSIRSLKKSVAITLRNMEDNSPVTPPAYLTQSTKTLILIWLREKQRDRFNSLTDQGIVTALIGTNEYKTRKLVMEYSLGGIIVEGKRDCYIDLSEEKLHYIEAAGKTTIAAEISRALTENDYDEHLELWIKGALGANEEELSAELRKNNWQIPDELVELMSAHTTSSDKSDTDEPSTEDPTGYQEEAENKEEACFSDDKADESNGADDDRADESTASSSHDDAQQHYKNRKSNSGGSSGQSSGKGANNKTNSGERSGFEEDSEAEDSEEDTETKQSFADELFSCFNTKDQPIHDNEWSDDNDNSHDPNGRYEKEYDRARDKSEDSRTQNERYREVRRRILDGPDPVVREYLYRWYSGKCQICGSTFYQKNGRPFFISHFLVPRKVSDSADMIGNSICLCANHFAQMVYGRLQSPEIIDQLENIDPEGINFEIDITMDGVDLSIKYIQKHALALKAFYEATKHNR